MAHGTDGPKRQAAKVQMEAGQDLGGRWQTKNGVEC